ncbi:MAG: S8 family serine peptidase [Solirubrobacteraceae bacterium]
MRRTTSAHPATRAGAHASSTRLSPLPAPSPASGEVGYTPEDLHVAYELPATAPPSQTIALVDAYNDPTAAADLTAYSEEFGLPECGSGCFTQYNEHGETTPTSLPFPKTTAELKSWRTSANKAKREEAAQAEGWGLEISLDVETAHAICNNCHIALVEASSTANTDLEAAERAAASLPISATEISNSWGSPECFEAPPVRQCEEGQAFNHPGIVVTASAGDDGYLSWTAADSAERGFASFPASFPDVVAVGGTRLELNEDTHTWANETVWNDGGESGGVPDGHGAGGGGCSVVFAAQPWQQNVADWSAVGCGEHRAVADVAADADPYTGVAVRYSEPICSVEEEPGVVSLQDWCTIGGTSLASPLIASAFALAGGAGGVEYPAKTLYQHEKLRPGSLHDITASATSGSNGRCSQPFDEETALTACTPEQEATASCSLQLICLAHAGYDGPTGVGAPHGIRAFEALTKEETEELAQIEAQERAQAEAEFAAEERANAEARAKAEESRKAEERKEIEDQRQAEEIGNSTSSSSSGGSSTGAETTSTTTATTAFVRVSALALTLKALIALNTSRPKIAQIGFTFTINVAAHLVVSLQKRVVKHGHARWQAFTHPLTIAASSGRNSRRLARHGALSNGTYRLTLTPVHGSARSIVFKIG